MAQGHGYRCKNIEHAAVHHVIFAVKTHSLMTLSMMTLSMMALSMMALSMMALSMMALSMITLSMMALSMVTLSMMALSIVHCITNLTPGSGAATLHGGQRVRHLRSRWQRPVGG
jgi:hypothetical protein